MIEFQILKRQHAKLLKELELKLKAELDELKRKCEKDYTNSIQQYTKELDSLCAKHKKDLDERNRYDLNEEKKLVKNLEESNTKELKNYIIELTSEYKRKKEETKKELSAQRLDSKERAEQLKRVKEQLQNDRKRKEEEKKIKQDFNLNLELCKLKRKHLIMFHRLQCDIQNKEINEQVAMQAKTHDLLKNHLNLIYNLKEKHLKIKKTT